MLPPTNIPITDTTYLKKLHMATTLLERGQAYLQRENIAFMSNSSQWPFWGNDDVITHHVPCMHGGLDRPNARNQAYICMITPCKSSSSQLPAPSPPLPSCPATHPILEAMTGINNTSISHIKHRPLQLTHVTCKLCYESMKVYSMKG